MSTYTLANSTLKPLQRPTGASAQSGNARAASQRKYRKSFFGRRLKGRAEKIFCRSRTVIACVFHTFNGLPGNCLNLSGPQRSFPQSPVPTKTLTGPLCRSLMRVNPVTGPPLSLLPIPPLSLPPAVVLSVRSLVAMTPCPRETKNAGLAVALSWKC